MTLSEERVRTTGRTATLPANGETIVVDIGPLRLESGEVLDDVSIAVQAWGELSPNRDNVVMVLHALTGERLAPSWSATCYTRYTGPSEHMGEHCDKADSCKYNLLTYLDAAWPDGVSPRASK